MANTTSPKVKSKQQSAAKFQLKHAAKLTKPTLTKPTAKPARATQANMDKVDQMVKETGEADKGEPHLDLCPKCGSSEISIRRIDIPGFLPEVQVCNKCGFRSKSVLEIEPIEYVEDVGDEEEDMVSRLAEIEKRVQSGQYTTAEGKKRSKAARQGKAPGQRANAKFFAKVKSDPKSNPNPAAKPTPKQAKATKQPSSQAKKPNPMKKRR